MRDYYEQIYRANKNDIELYSWVEQENYKKSHIKNGNVRDSDRFTICHYIDYIIRKAYIQPITNRIRKSSGIRPDGSY